MQEVLGSVYIVAPNTGNVLQFDLCGYFTISDCYGKTLKRYRTFEKAINYILLND
jgi:hypothetical protein